MKPEDELKIAKLSTDDMYKCQKAFDMVKTYYLGDGDKTFIWFYTKNDNLENNFPKDLLISGGVDKLLKYLEKNMVH